MRVLLALNFGLANCQCCPKTITLDVDGTYSKTVMLSKLLSPELIMRAAVHLLRRMLAITCAGYTVQVNNHLLATENA